LHPKCQIQKEQLLSSPHWLCMERAKCYTDIYRETEGEAPPIRAAKALTKTFEEMSLEIYPEEILVGNKASQYVAPPFAPEKGDFNYVFKYLLPRLERFGYHILPKHKRVLFKEIIPYWEGRSVRALKVKKFKENGLSSGLNLSIKEIFRKFRAFGLAHLIGLVNEDEQLDESSESTGKRIQRFSKNLSLLFNLSKIIPALKGGAQDNVKGRGRCIDTQAHIVVGHKNVLKYGFKGIKEKAHKRLESVKTEKEKDFLRSVEMVCDAIREFSKRFSNLARIKAKDETNNERKKELLELAEVCEKVPWNPPQSFYSAIQSLWFTQNAVLISYGAGSGITPGRVDQLLYPYYKKDIEEGKITKDKVLRLLEEFIIKINNNVVVWPNIAGVRLNHLGSDIENITIGGLSRNGDDACNELSYLFIEAIKNTKLATSASFRISKKTPEDFLKKVVELHKETNGPALFNDEIVIEAMMKDGYSLEDARDYCLVGCVEPNGNGDTFGATGGVKVYFPTALDLVFNRGKTTFFGNQDTDDLGNPQDFLSFGEFMNAYYKQLEQLVLYVAEANNLRDEIWAERFPNPLISCTIDGCIENAKDMTAGGAKYNFVAIGGGGLGTIADSLAAIKRFVYDEKSIKMKDLMLALECNFKSSEPLRQHIVNGPKFGNDDDYVDEIAVELVDRFCEMTSSKKLKSGGHYKASFISYGLNIYEGALEPATPDGRRAGQPISNSISPTNGAEKKGPTATINSLAKIDHTKIGFGDSLNMRFPKYLLNSNKGVESLEALIQTYFEKGGFHIQFNTIGTETLRDAKEHPEKYEDLIVRVSGYSAYFTRLGKEIQDDIIERTEFGDSF